MVRKTDEVLIVEKGIRNMIIGDHEDCETSHICSFVAVFFSHAPHLQVPIHKDFAAFPVAKPAQIRQNVSVILKALTKKGEIHL